MDVRWIIKVAVVAQAVREDQSHVWQSLQEVALTANWLSAGGINRGGKKDLIRPK